MKNKAKTDELCRYYVDAMAFFTHNMEVLNENAARKMREGKDPAKEQEAIKRLTCAKEGVQRMMSDRVAALGMKCMDMAEVIGDLVALKNVLHEANHAAVDNAVNMLVRQREKLTNTDRGRRALQKQMGKFKRQANLLGKEACALKENNEALRKALAPMMEERASLLMDSADLHCEMRRCKGCPFDKKCNDPGMTEEQKEETKYAVWDMIAKHREAKK